ncbi:uncharacterized protein LOC116413411 [Galleria mellonella]|uniref:Uncharacterized protein LOC116413411 n=1 Tax=Galleria mellonella TaxID=7137 RepID=A0A6J3CBB7_GALME|nr:uncharacterized protein LOC116413411 [Galleria mellonella]
MQPHKIIIIYFYITNSYISARSSHSGGHSYSNSHSYGHGTGSHGRSISAHHVYSHHGYYSYHPPSNIFFQCRYCNTPQMYPVYHGSPPTYVYKYRESGGHFGDLISGLALYNLGRISNEPHHYTSTHYTAHKKESCSLQIIDHEHFEETTFPCFMMSSFMANATAKEDPNAETFDISSSLIHVHPNVSTGSSLEVTNRQECTIWHNSTMNRENHTIPCTLLKQYADTVKSSGLPVYIWLPLLLAVVLAIYICCQCCAKKNKEDLKETAPLNQMNNMGYCSN